MAGLEKLMKALSDENKKLVKKTKEYYRAEGKMSVNAAFQVNILEKNRKTLIAMQEDHKRYSDDIFSYERKKRELHNAKLNEEARKASKKLGNTQTELMIKYQKEVEGNREKKIASMQTEAEAIEERKMQQEQEVALSSVLNMMGGGVSQTMGLTGVALQLFEEVKAETTDKGGGDGGEELYQEVVIPVAVPVDEPYD